MAAVEVAVEAGDGRPERGILGRHWRPPVAAGNGLVTQFRNRAIAVPGFYDQEGVHHEFASGLHGRKIDFDSLPDDSEAFDGWVRVVHQAIRRRYPRRGVGRFVLLSVANGTNRVVGPVAELLDDGTVPLNTEKTSARSVQLDTEALWDFQEHCPDFVLVLEDVATRGTLSASAVVSARRAGARHVAVLNSWQRSPELPELDLLDVPYQSIIHEYLPNLTPEACRNDGYCAQGWELIEHAK